MGTANCDLLGDRAESVCQVYKVTLCAYQKAETEHESSFNYSTLKDVFPSKITSGIRRGKSLFLGPCSNPPYIVFIGECLGIV